MRRLAWAGPSCGARGSGASSTAVDPAGGAAAPGSRLRAGGVNVDLAPVADVPGPGSFMAAQGRTFGTSPTSSAARLSAFAQGLADARVAAAVKHFPGIGARDAEHRPVRGRDPRRAARTLERASSPFRAAIAAGVPIVMVSNASYAALDGKPAPWSPRIQRLLRDELGFTGRDHHATRSTAPPPREAARCRRSRCSPRRRASTSCS